MCSICFRAGSSGCQSGALILIYFCWHFWLLSTKGFSRSTKSSSRSCARIPLVILCNAHLHVHKQVLRTEGEFIGFLAKKFGGYIIIYTEETRIWFPSPTSIALTICIMISLANAVTCDWILSWALSGCLQKGRSLDFVLANHGCSL